MIRMIVFLGNAGIRYRNTRHNAAWLMAERLSFAERLVWRKKFKGRFASQPVSGLKRLFLKPETYMNRSGESVQAAASYHRLNPQELVVVHDDIELAFGFVSLKQGGGLAGHNGLRSIAQALGTADFFRLRLGISRPRHGSVSSHVLGRFSAEEQDLLPALLGAAAEVLESCLAGDVEDVERRYARPVSVA